MDYSPRAVIYSLHRATHENLMGENGTEPKALLEGFLDSETPWLCTTCGACLHVCPMFVDPVSAVVDLRRYLTLTTGEVPGSVGETLMQMERRGNPWGLPQEEHAPWAKELGVRVLQPGDRTDVLLYIGCAYGYDSRNQAAGKALAGLLQKADVDFAILGTTEGCCGETARRMGHEYIFQVMAEENIATFGSVEFNRMVTSCAHCFNTLKNEYPRFGADFEVMHHTQFLTELNASGKLGGNGSLVGKQITFHDSCYLGRYNDIYEGPRRVLDQLEGVTRTEMNRHHSNAFCCGGGGGHMWMETDPNTRINQRRLEQVIEEAEAEIVVTACPYCLIMFDDAIRSKGVGEQVAAMDIAEANGYKLALFSYSTGVPLWRDWQGIVETGVFARAKEGGHALALHEYGWPTMDYLWGEPTEDQPPYDDRGVLAGRYRYLYRDFLIPRDEVIPLVITECGLDPLVPGPDLPTHWKERYVDEMIWYDSKLREDDYVVGGAMFTIGPYDTFEDYDYEELLWENDYGRSFLDYIVSLKDA
jgi:Fe-S oxidoreductase